MRRVALSAAAMLLPAAAPVGTSVTVQIGNIRNANGNVHVDLCAQAQFLTDNCAYGADGPHGCRNHDPRRAGRAAGSLCRAGVP